MTKTDTKTNTKTKTSLPVYLSLVTLYCNELLGSLGVPGIPNIGSDMPSALGLVCSHTSSVTESETNYD